MEEILKQLGPVLIKNSPWLVGGFVGLYFIVKMILDHLTEESKKKADALKERDDKRDALFKETLANREKFFLEELEKKDEVIQGYREEVKVLNDKVFSLFKDDIEVRKNNNVVMDHLSNLLKAALNNK